MGSSLPCGFRYAAEAVKERALPIIASDLLPHPVRKAKDPPVLHALKV